MCPQPIGGFCCDELQMLSRFAERQILLLTAAGVLLLPHG